MELTELLLSFNLEAKLLEGVAAVDVVAAGGAEVAGAAMASSCLGLNKINWNPWANLWEMSSVNISSLVGKLALVTNGDLSEAESLMISSGLRSYSLNT